MRRGVITRSVIGFCFGALLTSGALAEDLGGLSGTVIDARTQAPIPEAIVIAKSPALAGEQNGVTNEKGSFELTLLPPGIYGLSIQHKGYQVFAPEGLNVKPNRTVKVRLQLIPEETAESRLLAENPIEYTDKMKAPALVSGPNVEYTQQAIDRDVEGVISVRCVVNVAGIVHDCRVLKGLPFMNRAVTDTLERRKYKAATLQGKPLAVWYTFNIRLALPK